ncbi:CRISPR system precrRNA processing endoribonuclease RAMP protein Cas6 [Nautilia sp.]
MIKYSKITLKSEYVLPYRFTGSTLRGAFGVGLKKVVCINPSKECKGCFAKEGCLFYDFFEKQDPKYRLRINLSGNVSFDLLLFEGYALKAPYVVSALYKAFAEIGITKKRNKINFKLYFNDKPVFDGKNFLNFENEVLEYSIEDIKTKCKVLFLTPLRVKEKGVFVRDGVNVETILRTIYHKLHKLQNIPISKIPFTPEYTISSQNFSFIDFKRYSNRQKTAMNFGGVMGEIDFEYIDEKSYYLLKIGELIGVGKQTTFGLGEIKIK